MKFLLQKSSIIFAIGLAHLVPMVAHADDISKYQIVSLVVTDAKKNSFVAIRSFWSGQEQKYLVVNPESLITETISAQKVSVTKTKIAKTTQYARALKKYSSPPYEAANYGLTMASSPTSGVFLTIDMCPSHKTFERTFFEGLIKKKKGVSALPIAISLTGRWAQQHPEEFAWLIKQDRAGNFAITWINHSYHHYYPITKSAKHDMVDEILLVEKLPEKGELPSIFYRFPALSSDKRAIEKLRDLGLISVASDAWLAKGQRAVKGSIILVHGNSNEHIGIKMLNHLLETNPALKLLPLTEAVIDHQPRSTPRLWE